MACIKEYRRGTAIIRIFDDDVVKTPEEQRRLQNTLLNIGRQIRRDFARLPREEQERRLQQGRELERRMAETPLEEVPVCSSGPL
mgnify:CR=1 FL=1